MTQEELLAAQLRKLGLSDRPSTDELHNRLLINQSQAPDYSGVEAIGRSRTGAGSRDFLAGLIMSQMGGENARPLGQALASQGIENARPLRMNAADVGYYDQDTGRVTENPEFRSSRLDKTLLTQLGILEKADAARLTREEARLRRQEAVEKANEDRAARLLIAQGGWDVRREGYDEAMARARLKADAVKPPKALPAAQSKAWAENNTALGKIDEAIAEGLKNPDAFGLQNYLPGDLTQRLPGKEYKGGVSGRSKVADIGSLKIHDRSGAAVTAAEFPRLRPFIPLATDDWATVKTKLDNLKREYILMNEEISNYAEDMGYIKPTKPGDKAAKPAAAPRSSSTADDDLIKKYSQ
jgi:hypothetical protein